MRKQILAIISTLTLSTFVFAKPCTTENVGNSIKGEAKNTMWLSGTGDGAIAISINYTFSKVTGTIKQDGHVVNIVGFSKGNFVYDDPNDEYGTWEVSCSMNAQNNVMVTDGSVEFFLYSSFPAEMKTMDKSVDQKVNEDLGDWAPTPQ